MLDFVDSPAVLKAALWDAVLWRAVSDSGSTVWSKINDQLESPGISQERVYCPAERHGGRVTRDSAALEHRSG